MCRRHFETHCVQFIAVMVYFEKRIPDGVEFIECSWLVGVKVFVGLAWAFALSDIFFMRWGLRATYHHADRLLMTFDWKFNWKFDLNARCSPKNMFPFNKFFLKHVLLKADGELQSYIVINNTIQYFGGIPGYYVVFNPNNLYFRPAINSKLYLETHRETPGSAHESIHCAAGWCIETSRLKPHKPAIDNFRTFHLVFRDETLHVGMIFSPFVYMSISVTRKPMCLFKERLK